MQTKATYLQGHGMSGYVPGPFSSARSQDLLHHTSTQQRAGELACMASARWPARLKFPTARLSIVYLFKWRHLMVSTWTHGGSEVRCLFITLCPTNHCYCHYTLTRLLVIEQNRMSQRKSQQRWTFSSKVGQTKAETLNPLVHLLTRCAAAQHWLSHGSLRQLAWV